MHGFLLSFLCFPFAPVEVVKLGEAYAYQDSFPDLGYVDICQYFTEITIWFVGKVSLLLSYIWQHFDCHGTSRLDG